MSDIICLLIGLILGAGICYIGYNSILSIKDDLIEDYKKGINLHNARELKLIFINQSIKDYVKQQLNMIKNDTDLKEEDQTLAAIRYIAFKDIEKTINQLEKNSEDLINK